MSAGVSLSFDVDGEAGLAGRATPAGGWAGRLSTVSEARFGIMRGVPRVLAVLAAYDVHATFYVPGLTVRRDPAAIADIAHAGHEIAHHGFAHLPTHELDHAGQRHELDAGLAALKDCLGVRPTGYRSPAWELTPVTLQLLGELGFTYDSSLMGDDRPYRLANGLIELPVHWSLDDVPFFAYGPGLSGRITDADVLARAWIAEHDSAQADQRHLTYTMHPDIIARGHRFTVLERLLDHITHHHTPTYTHHQTADAH